MVTICGDAAGGVDAEYDEFAALHGRTHTSQSDYEARRRVYHSNKALVAQGNARPLGYSLALNRFADWTQVRLWDTASNIER